MQPVSRGEDSQTTDLVLVFQAQKLGDIPTKRRSNHGCMFSISKGSIFLIDKGFDDIHDKLPILDTLASKLHTRDIGLLVLPGRVFVHPLQTIVINGNNNHATNVWIPLDGWNDLPGMTCIGLLAIQNVLPIVEINHRVATICIYFIILR